MGKLVLLRGIIWVSLPDIEGARRPGVGMGHADLMCTCVLHRQRNMDALQYDEAQVEKLELERRQLKQEISQLRDKLEQLESRWVHLQRGSWF